MLYREGYYPFGERLIKEENEHSQWFTGKRHDEELGLSYFGARWYDPVVGRFTGIDAVEPVPDIISSFNRYAYSHNNPYSYVDSDGNFAFLIPIAIFLAKEIASEVVEQTTGVSMPTIKNGVKYASKKLGKTLGKGKPCCFVAGTEVLTQSGYTAIEQVKLGDLVWAKNTQTLESDWKPVIKLFTEPNRQIFELVFEDTSGDAVKIEVSDNHPFRVGSDWVEVKDLTVGQLVETKKAGLLELKSWNKTSRYELTYNFTVDDFHTYYVTQFDVLVHNCGDKKVFDRGDNNRTPASPAIGESPYSPKNVSKRQTELREQLGLNKDPNTKIPDQSPGKNLKGGVHTSDGKSAHVTGERNVNSKQEHSRIAKGSGGSRGGRH